MHNLTVTGTRATVQWGYQCAAQIRDWTISKDDQGQLRLTATIASGHTFRLSQRPLMVQTPRWAWQILELQIEGASLTAVLGPQEPHHVYSVSTPGNDSTHH
jgi:hypothetical protein